MNAWARHLRRSPQPAEGEKIDAGVINFNLELGDLKLAHARCQMTIEIGLSARVKNEDRVGDAGIE